jgi:hypothetical protein
MIRHGLALIAIALRSFGVLKTPANARCVAMLRFGDRPGTSGPRASARAITLVTIAGGADENFCATTSTGTEKAASGIAHRRSTHHRRAIDKRPRCVLRYVHTRDRHGGGTAFGLTATFRPMPCPGLPGPFSPLLRSRHQVPSFRRAGAHAASSGRDAVDALPGNGKITSRFTQSTEKRGLLVLMETVETAVPTVSTALRLLRDRKQKRRTNE